MILPDVNVLIYAFRLDMPQHRLCRKWLDEVRMSPRRFGISPQVLSSVVRITTDPRIFAVPNELDEALSFCDSLFSHPNCDVVHPGRRHWSIFRDLLASTRTRGRRVTDAWFAALAIEAECEWITMDRDFRRFPGLAWREPS